MHSSFIDSLDLQVLHQYRIITNFGKTLTAHEDFGASPTFFVSC